MDYYYAFKEGLKLILRYFGRFIKKLGVIVFVYGLSMGIPIIFSLLLSWVLSLIPGISTDIKGMIIKIVLTAGQIVPLSIYLYCSENDSDLKEANEDAPELCFACCAAVITWIWTCL